MSGKRGLKTVALFEATKGLLVLLVGFGTLEFVHRDVQEFAEKVVADMHLNPSSHYPRIFLELAEKATTRRLLMLAAGAAVYAAIRFAEAYGLWRDRRWAEWFAVISGGIYVPLELWQLAEQFTWVRLTILLANLLIVWYLARLLQQKNIDRKRTSSTVRAG